MKTFDSFWINEIRIPIDILNTISIDICSIPSLSVSHKKSIENKLWEQLGRISIIDGNVLYSIRTKNNEPENKLTEFLTDQIRGINPKNLNHIQLKDISKKVFEKLIFLLIKLQARKHNYFHMGGDTLFEMHDKHFKKAYRTINLQVTQENDCVKIFVVPSMSVLINLQETERSQLHETELIRLCQFRDECPVLKTNRKCHYSFPEKIGYYIKRNKFQELNIQQQQAIPEFYKDCPQFSQDGQDIVWVKPTRKSKNSRAFPLFLLSTTASDIDLRTLGLFDRYRQETLMTSEKRYTLTFSFIDKVFGAEGHIKINDLSIQFENIFNYEGSPDPMNNKTKYKCQILKPLQVSVNPNDSYGRQTSGGYQFQHNGSYDRNDLKRPFKKISLIVIAPNSQASKNLVFNLLKCLGDIGYSKKDKSLTYYNDIDFPCLNSSNALSMFNSELIKPSEKDIHFIQPTEQEYLTTSIQIKREYLSSEKIDNNKIVLIVLPENTTGSEYHPYYSELKKIFIEEGIPSQFLSIEKLKGLTDSKEPFGNVLWNLFLDIYVKLGGKPWRLVNQVGNVNCFIGVGFAINPYSSKNHIYTGVANVFDKYGNWLDITSDYEKIDEEQRFDFSDGSNLLEGTASFKISKSVTKKIVSDSLNLYRLTQTKQQIYPHNIVFHKLGQIYQCEIEGILEAISETNGTFQNCQIGIASIHAFHNIRLYGQIFDEKKPNKANRVVLRGMDVSLSPMKEILSTTGMFIRKEIPYYFGIGTPRPLIIEGIIPDEKTLKSYNILQSQFYSTNELTSHIFSLTQLHWGSMREDIHYPITVLYAKRVADSISKNGITRLNNVFTNIKRPWFI